jgi:threonine dehydratase
MPDAVSFADILDAAGRLSGQAVRTPLLRHDALDAMAGGRLFIKAEPLQVTGSFKFRGAYNRLSRLTETERCGGVVAFSSGNHAQGVAAAAKRVGCPALILMPHDAPRTKVAATKALGAEVEHFDRFKDDREAIGIARATERGAVLVPPFDDPFIIAGQGTVGLEIAHQTAEIGVTPDVVCACASGGGLIAGLALALEHEAPGVRVIVAEPADYDDHALSLASGERTAHAPAGPSLCDALLAPIPGRLTFPINVRRLSGAVSATDEEVLDAMAHAYTHLKLVIEPGGAVGLAAALLGRLNLNGGAAVIVASGGNVDPDVYARALSRL